MTSNYTYQDDIERCPEFVGDAGKELRFGAQGSLGFQLGLLQLTTLHEQLEISSGRGGKEGRREGETEGGRAM